MKLDQKFQRKKFSERFGGGQVSECQQSQDSSITGCMGSKKPTPNKKGKTFSWLGGRLSLSIEWECPDNEVIPCRKEENNRLAKEIQDIRKSMDIPNLTVTRWELEDLGGR